MLKNEVKKALDAIMERMGEGIEALSFQISIENDSIKLDTGKFNLALDYDKNGKTVFTGRWRDISAFWEFTFWEGGYWVTLSIRSEGCLNCTSIDSLIVEYACDEPDSKEWYLPMLSKDYMDTCMQVKELKDAAKSGKILAGVFKNSRSKGIFAGTRIPQRHLHQYEIKAMNDKALQLTCTTSCTEGIGRSGRVDSEASWICANKNIGDAIKAYSQHVPAITPRQESPTGWNSWDYYLRTVSLADVIENMEEIKKDKVLSKHIKYIVVDDGWQHVWGEWHPNYKFPGGLERLAEEIGSRGFIPGIWTAPLMLEMLSKPAIRMYDMLAKDEYGDPLETGDYYIIDPTHPKAKAFIGEIYTRLYKAGFRLFKVDYVFPLLKGKQLYNPEKGIYDAIRDLFTLIRECVTGESHITGCSLPAECGPGYADSGRIGIDIHNHWSRVEWVFDSLQLSYWQHGRVWINDPDFLIVRGKNTSTEAEINVLNLKKNKPVQGRGIRGPVFTMDEAGTWANIVALSGGSVFLSDRISKLTDEAKTMLDRYLEPTGIAARPLDICDGKRASFCLQELEKEFRLTIINWNGETKEKTFLFKEYGLDIPNEVKDFRTDEKIMVEEGKLGIKLRSHESTVVYWLKKR